MHRCSPKKHRQQPPAKRPKIPPELEPPRSGPGYTTAAALITLALFIGAAAGLSVTTMVNLRVHLVVSVPPVGTGPVTTTLPVGAAEPDQPLQERLTPEMPIEAINSAMRPALSAETAFSSESPRLPLTQRATVRAVGGRGGIFLEAHCDEDTFAREHDLLALMRDEPGKAKPTFIGLVDVVRVRDSRMVAVALGGKPALGDTLLVEAREEFAAAR